MGATKKAMMEKAEAEARLAQIFGQLPPEALVADGFDEALLGVCHRFGQEPVAAYDYEKCISVLMKDMTRDEAEEYFQFNVIGAWVGEYTPVFICVFEEGCIKKEGANAPRAAKVNNG